MTTKTTPAPPSLMVSIAEAATIMGVSQSTVRNMLTDGRWPDSVTHRRVGTRWLVNRDQLEAWCRGDAP